MIKVIWIPECRQSKTLLNYKLWWSSLTKGQEKTYFYWCQLLHVLLYTTRFVRNHLIWCRYFYTTRSDAEITSECYITRRMSSLSICTKQHSTYTHLSSVRSASTCVLACILTVLKRPAINNECDASSRGLQWTGVSLYTLVHAHTFSICSIICGQLEGRPKAELAF